MTTKRRPFHVSLKPRSGGADVPLMDGGANSIRFPMVGRSAVFQDIPKLSSSGAVAISTSSIRFPVRPFNPSNFANWIEGVQEFYQKLSEKDRLALTFIDFVRITGNAWPVGGEKAVAALTTTTWGNVPLRPPIPLSTAMARFIPLNIPQPPPLPVGISGTKSESITQTFAPFVGSSPSSISLQDKMTGLWCEEAYSESAANIYTTHESKLRQGSLCGENELVWPVGYLFKVFPQLTIFEVRRRISEILRAAPKLQSTMTLYRAVRKDQIQIVILRSPDGRSSIRKTADINVPAQGYIILDSSPKRALHRAIQMYRDDEYVAVRVELDAGTPALPIVMPTAQGILQGLMAIAVPNDFTTMTIVQQNVSRCTGSREFSKAGEPILSGPEAASIKPSYYACQIVPEESFKFITKRADVEMKSHLTKPNKIDWPTLPTVFMHPPIASFRDVPLDLFLPTKVPKSCETSRWTHFLKVLAANFRISVCLPPYDHQKMRPRSNEVKTIADSLILDLDQEDSGIVLVDPSIQSGFSASTQRRLYWYEYAESPIPPSARSLKSPCSATLTIVPLTFFSFEPKTPIESKEYQGHANALIIDHRRKIIDRFEPHGERTGSMKLDFVDRVLPIVLQRILPEYRYEPPSASCPVLGPQSYSAEAEREVAAKGYCLCWALLMVSLRILNPEWNTSQIIRQMNRVGATNISASLPPITRYIFPEPIFSRYRQMMSVVPIKQHRLYMTAYVQAFMEYYNSITM